MIEASTPSSPLTAERSPWLRGPIRLPGDPAQSHVTLLVAAMARGESVIENLSTAPSIAILVRALEQLGVNLGPSNGRFHVQGMGVGGLLPPDGPIELRDAGETGALLLIALLAGHGFTSHFASLPDAPMIGALLDFFRRNGAGVEADAHGVTLRPARFPIPLDLALSTEARALVAPLLLHCAVVTGRSLLHLPAGLTDPAEGVLTLFGAKLKASTGDDMTTLSIDGMAPLRAQAVAVPGDPALAAYPALAALVAPDSELVIETVALNPGSLALLDALALLGGDIALGPARRGGAGIADITVRHCPLTGTTIPGDLGLMPDDYAALAVAAAFAEGETNLEAMGEGGLRANLTGALRANGVECLEQPGGLLVRGKPRVPGGGYVKARLDPKLAMSFLVLGMAADKPVTIDDGAAMANLFPQFVSAFEHVGASFSTDAAA